MSEDSQSCRCYRWVTALLLLDQITSMTWLFDLATRSWYVKQTVPPTLQGLVFVQYFQHQVLSGIFHTAWCLDSSWTCETYFMTNYMFVAHEYFLQSSRLEEDSMQAVSRSLSGGNNLIVWIIMNQQLGILTQYIQIITGSRAALPWADGWMGGEGRSLWDGAAGRGCLVHTCKDHTSPFVGWGRSEPGIS